MATPSTGAPAPLTQDEMNLASLAHFLQLGTGPIAALVIYAYKRESRFVAFHALQAIFLQVVYLAAVFSSFGLLIAAESARVKPGEGPAATPPALPFLGLLAVLFFVGGGFLTIYCAIAFGIKASRGEWAEIPIVGRWALQKIRA